MSHVHHQHAAQRVIAGHRRQQHPRNKIARVREHFVHGKAGLRKLRSDASTNILRALCNAFQRVSVQSSFQGILHVGQHPLHVPHRVGIRRSGTSVCGLRYMHCPGWITM